MAEQVHRSDPRVLGRRTLERDHRRLAALLRPGLSVLDVGCGTGAITAGIAREVAPGGQVVGIDRDESLLAIAREEDRDAANLRFDSGDVLALAAERVFDVVTAARVLQWVSRPGEALKRMTAAAKPGGRVVVLDYDHEASSWTPEPPPEFLRFYRGFLDWRSANDWDNRMAEHLPALFESAGLTGIEAYVDDEIAVRGQPGFAEAAAIFLHVASTAGHHVVEAGFLKEDERRAAEEQFAAFIEGRLEKQVLVMRTVAGTAP